MANSPLITILISVFNGEQTVRRTLDGVFSQTFQDYEVVVVDDGSTDGTQALLRSFSDSRLRLLFNEANANEGLTRSLHRGVLEARGKYIARIDDGHDRISSEWLAKCVAPLEQDEKIVLCGPRIRRWRGSQWEESSQPTDPDILRWILILHNCVAHAGAIFRRVVGGRIQNYDPSFLMSQDYELWSRLSRIGKVCIVPECLVEIVYTESGITKQKGIEQAAFAAQVRLAQQRWLLGRGDISLDAAKAAAALYWGWSGINASDALRGSCLLRRLRGAYLRRFGTPAVAAHLQGRYLELAHGLFHRARKCASHSRRSASKYLLAGWVMKPSEIFSRQSLEIMVGLRRSMRYPAAS